MLFLRSFATAALGLIILAGLTSAATPDDWRSRSIYQLLTDRFAVANGSASVPCSTGFEGFCGGTWQGIVKQLPYIQSMGFDAIWISPITKQIDNPSRAYHGYSQQDLYSVNANFGTEQDLIDLAFALHARSMYLMIDVVVNHFGANTPITTIDFTQMNPFKAASDFHTWCTITDDNDVNQITKCSLGTASYPLPDVKTEDATIRSTYSSWIAGLVKTYSIDGFRIDSVKNVEIGFWPSFQAAASVYTVGEVSDGRVDHACPYQAPSSSNGGALDGILNYPLFYQLTYFFNNTATTSTNLINLIKTLQSSCKDVNLLAPFSENHDQPRFASYTPDISLASNALAFTLLADGIPIVYSGQEQHLSGSHDPYNREAIWLTGYKPTALTNLIATLNALRKQAIRLSAAYTTHKSEVIASGDHAIVTRKGVSGAQIVAVYSNVGESRELSVMVPGTSGFYTNNAVTEVVRCKQRTVGVGGILEAEVTGGMPAVFIATDSLRGTGICGL